MTDRRSTYFIFQSLLTAVLLLFFIYQHQFSFAEYIRLLLLVVVLGGLLVAILSAPAEWLMRPKAQGGLFLIDVVLSTIILSWARQSQSDLFLTYFLVIFGTALTQNMTQSFLVALIATLLYGYTAAKNAHGLPSEAEFWLRLPYLWIAASFTGMLSRDVRESRQAQDQMFQKRLFHIERLAALGQISAEIAHRIKAPLTTIRVNAEVLAHQKEMSAKSRDELVRIQTEVDRCKEILQKLLSLGRIEELDLQSMDLRDAVGSAVERIHAQAEAQRIDVHVEGLDQEARVQGDKTLLSEALSAILQNALEAMPQGGALRMGLHWVRTGGWWLTRRTNKDFFDISIEDSGTGIAPELLEMIFQPFFTTKVDQGNGLGLSAALRILDKHAGSIKVESDGPGKGARFTLTIPAEVKQ